MPKRSYYDKISEYQNKIRKLESKAGKRRLRIIYSSESDSDKNSDNEAEDCIISDPPEDELLTTEQCCDERSQAAPPHKDKTDDEEPTSKDDPHQNPNLEEVLSALDPDILSALGETTEESPKFGEKIHENLARLWMPILRKGLKKDLKEKLLKEFLIPENCPLLQAPKLNPEISAAVTDATRTRDKRVEAVQQQLGLGITALNRALALLVNSDDKKLEAIKLLSDSCRILCDLHYGETQARVKFVTPGLDKSFLNVVQDVDRDDMLFGNKLSEKIKASKVIEKQGLQIKKPAPPPKQIPSTSYSSTNRPRHQGNWVAPPRYQSNKGGREGSRKTAPAGTSNRRAPSTNQAKSSHQSKSHRAPAQHQ